MRRYVSFAGLEAGHVMPVWKYVTGALSKSTKMITDCDSLSLFTVLM
jgi:hypothetical protein